MDRLVNQLIKTMKDKGLTLALAESMTCGMASFKLSNTVGTSEVLKGSIICYTPEVKTSLLKITEKEIKKYSCESKEVTESLARHLKDLVKADIYAAITGLAAAGGSETKEKPVGTVFFSVMNKKIHNYRKRFYGSPLEVKTKACIELYKLILKHL
jgi:nicotinamide-nucleotide amidase